MEGLTFDRFLTLCFSQRLCLQGSVQPAEIRDLLDDFGSEAGRLIQEAQLFFPSALGSAKFRAARHS